MVKKTKSGKKTVSVEPNKKWYESKTMWINLGLAMAGITTTLLESVQAGTPITVMAVMNIVLRYMTKYEIKF